MVPPVNANHAIHISSHDLRISRDLHKKYHFLAIKITNFFQTLEYCVSKYPRRSNFQIIEQFDFLLSKIDKKMKKWFWIEIAFFLYRIFEQKSCSIVVVRFKCGKIKEWSKSRIWFVSRPQENVPFILNKIYDGVHGYEITSFGDRYGTPRFWMIVLFTIGSVSVFFVVFSTLVKWSASSRWS